jgi:hypothetical protein
MAKREGVEVANYTDKKENRNSEGIGSVAKSYIYD